MSPTSSRVTVATSSVDSAIEVGRTTSSAASKSAIVTVGASAVLLPQRRPDAGLAGQRGQVGGDEPGRTRGHVVQPHVLGQRHPPGQHGRAARGASRRPAAAPRSARSSRSGARSDGSTASGRLVVHTTATPAAHSLRDDLPEHGRERPGRRRAARAPPRPRPAARPGRRTGRRRASVRSRPAAASLVSAASSGAQTGSTRAPTLAATARTSADLPEPAGPVTSTPERHGGAEPAQHLAVVEAEVEQLGQLLGLGAQAGQVVEAGRRRARVGRGRAPGRHRGDGGAAGAWVAARPPADHGVHGDQRGVGVARPPTTVSSALVQA